MGLSVWWFLLFSKPKFCTKTLYLSFGIFQSKPLEMYSCVVIYNYLQLFFQLTDFNSDISVIPECYCVIWVGQYPLQQSYSPYLMGLERDLLLRLKEASLYNSQDLFDGLYWICVVLFTQYMFENLSYNFGFKPIYPGVEIQSVIQTHNVTSKLLDQVVWIIPVVQS